MFRNTLVLSCLFAWGPFLAADDSESLKRSILMHNAKIAKLEQAVFSKRAVLTGPTGGAWNSSSRSSVTIEQDGRYLVYGTYDCYSYGSAEGRTSTERITVNGNVVKQLNENMCYNGGSIAPYPNTNATEWPVNVKRTKGSKQEAWLMKMYPSSKSSIPTVVVLSKGDIIEFSASGWSVNKYSRAKLYAIPL